MNRPMTFRAWTGKRMLYQDKQYLASFIRRVVQQINLDHERGFSQAHESYLPNGGNIDEYLMQSTGLTDTHGREIYEGDIIRYGFFALNDVNKFGIEPWNHLPEGTEETDITTEQMRYVVEWDFSKLAALQSHINRDPDVLGVEIIGNIYETPELLEVK